jgi:hypothetical protein
MTISRRALFVMLSLGSICAAVGCAYGYLVLALRVGNTNQDPTVERIAIAWLLGTGACVLLAIGFGLAAVFSRVRNG